MFYIYFSEPIFYFFCHSSEPSSQHRNYSSFRHPLCALYVWLCVTHPHSTMGTTAQLSITQRNPTGALHRRLIDGSCRQLAIATSPQQEMERIQCSPTSSVALARAAMEVSADTAAASNGSASGGQASCLVVRRPSANMFVSPCPSTNPKAIFDSCFCRVLSNACF